SLMLQPFGYSSLALKPYGLGRFQVMDRAAPWVLASQLLMLAPLVLLAWRMRRLDPSVSSTPRRGSAARRGGPHARRARPDAEHRRPLGRTRTVVLDGAGRGARGARSLGQRQDLAAADDRRIRCADRRAHRAARRMCLGARLRPRAARAARPRVGVP